MNFQPSMQQQSHHYPSQPNLTSPSHQNAPLPYEPPRPSHMGYTQSPPPRTRFDSNPSFIPSNSNPNPYDNRLSSPPPLLQSHSSNSLISNNYPPHGIVPTLTPQGHLYGRTGAGGPEDDMNDSAPLLAHATPDARFGIPGQRRFQLSDAGSQAGIGGAGAGDIGVVPGAWQGGAGDEDEDNVHYGPVPNRVLRRNRTQKRVA
jgi:chitin synthase